MSEERAQEKGEKKSQDLTVRMARKTAEEMGLDGTEFERALREVMEGGLDSKKINYG